MIFRQITHDDLGWASSGQLGWHEIDSAPESVDPGRPNAVTCGWGQRAAVAASLLARFGADPVIRVVDGGVLGRGRFGHPLTREANDDERPDLTAAAGPP